MSSPLPGRQARISGKSRPGAGSVDLSYAYRLRDPQTLAHAFLNSVLFLDYDRVGFPYPVMPFQVNCYGSYVIARHGEPARFGVAEDRSELDPPGPTPQ